jgi:hypothetical protein
VCQMTHDELLVRVDNDEKFLEQYFGGKFKGQSALRAVVELCNFLDKKGHCCVPVKEIIQAIEKQLQ